MKQFDRLSQARPGQALGQPRASLSSRAAPKPSNIPPPSPGLIGVQGGGDITRNSTVSDLRRSGFEGPTNGIPTGSVTGGNGRAELASLGSYTTVHPEIKFIQSIKRFPRTRKRIVLHENQLV